MTGVASRGKLTYSCLCPWVANMVDVSPIQIPFTFFSASVCGDALFPKPHWRGADLGGERLTLNWEFWESHPRNAGFFPRCDCLVNFRIWQSVKLNSSRHKSQQGPEQSLLHRFMSPRGMSYSFPLSVKADSLAHESV